MTVDSSTAPRPLALVAGASGAIGMAVAELLIADDWDVVGTYCNRRPSSHAGAKWVWFDGTKNDGGHELQTILAADQRPISSIISCIGAPSSKLRISDTVPGEFSSVFATNVIAVVRLWQILCEHARLGAAGVVILSSDTTTTLRSGNGAYSAAKAGLEALAITLASEEAEYGVRVNLVSPSLVASPLAEEILQRKGVKNVKEYYQELPWGRPLSIPEVSRVAVDIATAPQWRYASGQVIRIAVRA